MPHATHDRPVPTPPDPRAHAGAAPSRRAAGRTSLLFALVLAAGLVLAACGSSKSSGAKSSDTSGAGTTAAAGGAYGGSPDTSMSSDTSSLSSGAGAGASGSAAVQVSSEGTIGEHLVDSEGRTLYLFEADHGLKTACTAQCISAWPPATATSATAGKGLDASKLTTVAGAAKDQLAYNGHLLYRYAGDKAAGDTNGTAIPEWYAVSPEGDSIEAGH